MSTDRHLLSADGLAARAIHLGRFTAATIGTKTMRGFGVLALTARTLKFRMT